jgi:hypothetical protein
MRELLTVRKGEPGCIILGDGDKHIRVRFADTESATKEEIANVLCSPRGKKALVDTGFPLAISLDWFWERAGVLRFADVSFPLASVERSWLPRKRFTLTLHPYMWSGTRKQNIWFNAVMGYMVQGMPEGQVAWITNSRLGHQKPAWKIGWTFADYRNQMPSEFETPVAALAYLQGAIDKA